MLARWKAVASASDVSQTSKRSRSSSRATRAFLAVFGKLDCICVEQYDKTLPSRGPSPLTNSASSRSRPHHNPHPLTMLGVSRTASQ